MFNFSTVLYNPQPNTLFFSPFPFFHSSLTPFKFQSLKFPTNSNLRNSLSLTHQDDDDSYEEHVIGDCLVFEEGIFEDPIFPSDNLVDNKKTRPISKKKKKKTTTVIKRENLVPAKWREVQADLNMTKKDKRKIAQEMEFNSKVLKKKSAFVPVRDIKNSDEYKDYKESRLATLNPVVLDKPPVIRSENLATDRWREVQADLMKKDSKIAQGTKFNSKVLKKKIALIPARDIKNSDEYKAYKAARLATLNPVFLDKPPSFSFAEKDDDFEEEFSDGSGDDIEEEFSDGSGDDERRVEPKNPRWAVYGRGLEDVNEFLNSESYANKTEGRRRLFTWEEKALLKKKKPDLEVATSDKWLPLHTLAASGESFLVETMLKHDVDINAVDKDGLTALYKAVIGRKHAITNYLLRNSANPFVQDNDGATLMHYAVQTASVATIKVLLLYNVDLNLPDNDGWTPLHLAVQTQRNDIVKLLLIKGADKTLKNKDGLTPLDLCLYSGQCTKTYELIKLFKRTRNPRNRYRISRNAQQME